MKRFLYWLSGYLPVNLIYDNGRPYLERYYLFQANGCTHYLHRFVGSDPGRAKHSHPFRWMFSILLSGWYWEENSYGFKLVKWFNFLTGESFHRVILPDETKDVWTIFIHTSEKVKPWGFMRRDPDLLNVTFNEKYREAGYVFVPHLSSPNEAWWLTAPKGRDSNRLPLDRSDANLQAGQ